MVDEHGDDQGDDRLERERKFDVPDGWAVPPLAEIVPVGGSVVRETLRLTTSYFDTADLDLVRAGVTLRRRTGDADTGWHLKVPAGGARLEIRHPPTDGESGVPEDLLTATAGLRASRPVAIVATLVTERAAHRILAADGGTLAEVVLDDVHATAVGEAAVISRWREAEVELGSGSDKLLAGIAAALEQAGATPARHSSKLANALGRGVPERARPPGLAGLVCRYLDRQYAALVADDVALRRGRNAVHGTRTASRRYRSTLRTFAAVLDAERAARLDEELKWYAAALGRLRDAEIVLAEVESALDALPPELVLGPVRNRVRQEIAAESGEAGRALEQVMSGQRYFELLRELRAWREEPPILVDRPAADVSEFLDAARRKARRRLRRARATEPGRRDAAMHGARKAAKRLRYAAELAAPELGKRAEKTRKRARRRQAVLGRRQDHVIAAEFLLRAGRSAGTAPDENGFTFGLLYQRARDAAEAEEARLRR